MSACFPSSRLRLAQCLDLDQVVHGGCVKWLMFFTLTAAADHKLKDKIFNHLSTASRQTVFSDVMLILAGLPSKSVL